LEIVAEGRALPLKAAKQKTILALLLLHRGEVVSVDRLQEALWPERPPPTATTALQGYVSQLRRLLERGQEGGASLLVTRSPGYSLVAAAEQLDLARFEQLAASGREALAAGEPSRAAALLAEALALWRGPPLADFSYEAWAQSAIGRLEELRLSAVEDRIEADLACGRHGELVGELEAMLVEQPLRERLRGQLMLALYRAGRQADALEAYQAARRALVEELGIEPSPELQSLNHSILNQDEALAAPRRAVTARGQIELPVPATPLVGREHELQELAELLAARSVRLLTVTGPGGIGKTRVAVELAQKVANGYPDGVWFVDLSALRDPALVLPTVQQAVAPNEVIASRLAGTRSLLVLDNYEHVRASAQELSELLTAASGFQVLATSREPLHLSGEHEYALAPLGEVEATRLFLDRAYAIHRDLTPNGEVGEICRRLDGLPLAIELAAARVKLLSPAQILSRLDQRLSLLTTGALDVPERQRTLRATLEWSYELLSDGEKQLFCRLSVFAGGCTLAAAEDVSDADLDTLQSLIDKSLVRFSHERYRMLETIREYALEGLRRSGDAENLRERHSSFFEARAQDAAAELVGPEQSAWLRRLDQDLDNLRAALAWTIETGAYERGLQLASALKQFWYIRGHALEASRHLESLIEATTSASPTRLAALGTAAVMAIIPGDFERARKFAAEAIVLARETGDSAALVGPLTDLAGVEMAAGNRRQAARLYEEAGARAAKAGDSLAVAKANHNLANLALAEHDFAQAAALAEDSLRLAKSIGHTEGVSGSLEVLGIASLELDDHARAFEYLRGSLELSEELSHEVGAAHAAIALGAVAIRCNQPREGIKLIAAAEAFLAEAGVNIENVERELGASARDAARAVLSRDEFSAAWNEGLQTPLATAVQETLPS
jgi:predicted ATPase/DNA-binding SARP family transcriptional activator